MNSRPEAQITIRGGEHDHVRDLATTIDGIALEYAPMSLQELFPKMLATRCYEVCEFSLANYLMVRGAGGDWLSALPVFPFRKFRHSMVLVRRDSRLTDLRNLTGKKVGVPDYSMTAAVWVRGILRADYGVDHRAVTWVTPRKQRLPIPRGTQIEFADAPLDTLLERGLIDAMLGALAPSEHRFRTLLPDAEAAERDYLQRTGIYPIMHCVVIRNDTLARLPGLPDAVAQAYAQAKRRAYARRSPSVLPWGHAKWDEDMAVFAGDPLPYGLNAVNRNVVGTLAEDLREQGFVDALPSLDRLFVPVTSLVSS